MASPISRRALAAAAATAILLGLSGCSSGGQSASVTPPPASGTGTLRIGVATDVGGGTSYSMLKTMDEAYKIQQLLGERLNPYESFYHMTLGNAEALSLADRIGTLEAGTDADFVVLDAAATPAMALKMEVVRSLTDELFLLQTLGDDRAVRETYVAGRPMKAVL